MHLKEVKFKLFIILMIMFYDIAFNENNKEIIKSLISFRASQGCATPAASLPSDYMPACTVSILAAIQLNIYMSMPFQKTTI